MTEKIDRKRLAETFTTLCEISSPSGKEGRICQHLKELFSRLGADLIYEDRSAGKTGSEAGNLIIRFNGNLPDQEGIFFSCHMDTVSPGEGVKVVRNGNIFTSAGDTILGADDKSGITAVIETLTILKEERIPHPQIEVIITTCEEIGLVGAKNVEYDKIRSRYGYALDSSGINRVVVAAPAANKIKITVKGRAAHAGLCPENGISAFQLAAKALCSMQLGRLDGESTCNFGVIHGGIATNIVPERVTLEGEVRSHSTEKLDRYTEDIRRQFQRVMDEWTPSEATGPDRPSFEMEVKNDFPALSLAPESPVIKRIEAAARAANKSLSYVTAGGGSDANIYCGQGLPTAIIATGMEKVHTLDEQLDLEDLVSLTELIYNLAIIPGDN
jgi:tripeptide aminopeptidase